MPAAACLVTAPLIAGLSGGVGLVAVAANLLAAPAVAPATVLGVLAAVLSPVSMPAAQGCAWLAGPAVGWLVAVADRAAAVPGGVVPWPDGAGGAVLLAVSVLAVTLLCPLPADPSAASRPGRRAVAGAGAHPRGAPGLAPVELGRGGVRRRSGRRAGPGGRAAGAGGARRRRARRRAGGRLPGPARGDGAGDGAGQPPARGPRRRARRGAARPVGRRDRHRARP